MASFIVAAGHPFAVGQTVSVYRNFGQQPRDAPIGNAVTSAVVAADSTLTITGLTDGLNYYAVAQVNSVWRWVSLSPHVEIPTQPGSILAQAVGTTNSPTRTSTSFALLEEMTITREFSGDPCIIFFTGSFFHSTGGKYVAIKPQFDGADLASGEPLRDFVAPDTNYSETLAGIWPITPDEGEHTVEIVWATEAATATSNGMRRRLVLLEL